MNKSRRINSYQCQYVHQFEDPPMGFPISPFTSSCKISYSRKETIFEAKPFLWFSHISIF
ncbi:unnamed protein product, partial [Vitis vinifera]|uniref:Uncharacterized protein n=1 Tax=Vitis vinifera TaxID=29760 RepID=D7SRX8_VITVI